VKKDKSEKVYLSLASSAVFYQTGILERSTFSPIHFLG
jgi:hypothetical protein